MSKLSPGQRLSLAVAMEQSFAPVVDIEPRSCWKDIVATIRGVNYKNYKCNSSDCSSEKYQNATESVMCCSCRLWYHGGTCANYNKGTVFFFCPKCEAKMSHDLADKL